MLALLLSALLLFILILLPGLLCFHLISKLFICIGCWLLDHYIAPSDWKDEEILTSYFLRV